MDVNNTISSRSAIFVLLITLFFAGLLAFFSLQEGHDWGGDFALYLRQAQSLLDGTTEELLAFNAFSMNNSSLGPPSNPQIGPHLYPWGFPLLLSPVVAIAGFNIMLTKLYIIMFFLLSLLACYYLFIPHLGRGYSLMLVALLAFNPFLLDFSNIIISDIPFLFFCLLSLIFVEKALGYRSYFFNKAVTYVLTGFLILFAFLIRTNGIVLLGVLGIGHLMRWYQPLRTQFRNTLQKEWKELLPYISFAGFMILFKLWLPGGDGSHLEFLKQITPGKLAWNILYYLEIPVEFYSGLVFPMLWYGMSMPFLVLGIWHGRKRMPDVLYLVFCAASMVIFILWPPVQGLRFIFPLLPFYIYFIFKGLQYLKKSFSNYEGKKITDFIVLYSALLGVLFIYTSSSVALKNFPERQMIEGPYTPASQEVFAFVEKETEPRDIIVFFKPRVLSFMAKRQSLRITYLDEIKAGKGDYLLYYKPVDFGQLLGEEYKVLKSVLSPVFENEEYVLYNLKEWSVPASLATSKRVHSF